MLKISNKERGVTLIEIVIAIAVLGIIFATLGSAIIFGIRNSKFSGQRERAGYLASEGIEAVRNIRNEKFSNLNDGVYGLVLNEGSWILSGLEDHVDEFTREIEVSAIDENSKEIIARVSWDNISDRPGYVEVATKLTNWQQEILAVSDWSNPQEEIAVDLPYMQNGNKVQIQGDYAYLITTGGNPNFFIINISDPTNPNISGGLSLPGGPINLAVNGNYAYIGSNRNNMELQIINITNPASPSLISSINLPGNFTTNGIYYTNSKVYVTLTNSNENKISIIDTTSPSNPLLIGSSNLNSIPTEIYVSGSYAYISSAQDNQELQILNISNPASPQTVSSYNLNGNSDGLTITGDNNFVYLGRSNGDVAIIDISNPNSPALIGNYNNYNDYIRDITLDANHHYIFAASDANDAELQIIDINDPAYPSLLGFYDFEADLNGISYASDIDRVVAVSDSNSREFVIFKPN